MERLFVFVETKSWKNVGKQKWLKRKKKKKLKVRKFLMRKEPEN